jgi:hypothetical protein
LTHQVDSGTTSGWLSERSRQPEPSCRVGVMFEPAQARSRIVRKSNADRWNPPRKVFQDWQTKVANYCHFKRAEETLAEDGSSSAYHSGMC